MLKKFFEKSFYFAFQISQLVIEDSQNYGVELLDLYGEPVSYVCPELERRITEALIWDERIESVDNFEFNISKKGEVLVTFTAHTIFGDVVAEKVVNF